MMDKETSSTTAFNMAVATLIRIDALLFFINKLKIMKKHPLMMRNAIEGLYLELYPFLNDAERKEGDTSLKEIVSGVARKDEDTISFRRDIFELMYSFECWIRNKLNEKGLLMAKSDDPSKALGGG